MNESGRSVQPAAAFFGVAPGDVIVVDTSDSNLTAVLGDLISTKARHRGIAGFVVDGLVRDIEAIAELEGFPVFARGVTPIGPLHRGPGELNYPIAAGGIVVHPGDLVVGDGNGIVVVPRESMQDVLDRLRDRAALEAEYHAAVVREQSLLGNCLRLLGGRLGVGDCG